METLIWHRLYQSEVGRHTVSLWGAMTAQGQAANVVVIDDGKGRADMNLTLLTAETATLAEASTMFGKAEGEAPDTPNSMQHRLGRALGWAAASVMGGSTEVRRRSSLLTEFRSEVTAVARIEGRTP